MKRILFAILSVAAFFSCTRKSSDYELSLSMATGDVSGSYYSYGKVLSKVLSDNIRNLQINVLPTSASVENLQRMERGEVDLAIVQNDVLSYAYNGLEKFEGRPLRRFAPMLSLYSEVCQFVVKGDSAIENIADLRGKTISIGGDKSGGEINGMQILAEYGLSADSVSIVHLGFADAAKSLADGEIDAMFVVSGVPNAAVVEMAKNIDIRIVPVDMAVVARLVAKYPFYVCHTLHGGIYRNCDEDVQTLAVKSVLVASADVEKHDVYIMTKAIFDNYDEIILESPKGCAFDIDSELKGIFVPLHPGAAKYFQEKGFIR